MQRPLSPNGYDGMALDTGAATQHVETQQATQLSEPGSQRPADANLWGYLIPCNPQQRRIDFYKEKFEFKIGRNRDDSIGNDVVLGGMKISEFCSIVVPCGVMGFSPFRGHSGCMYVLTGFV